MLKLVNGQNYQQLGTCDTAARDAVVLWCLDDFDVADGAQTHRTFESDCLSVMVALYLSVCLVLCFGKNYQTDVFPLSSYLCSALPAQCFLILVFSLFEGHPRQSAVFSVPLYCNQNIIVLCCVSLNSFWDSLGFIWRLGIVDDYGVYCGILDSELDWFSTDTCLSDLYRIPCHVLLTLRWQVFSYAGVEQWGIVVDEVGLQDKTFPMRITAVETVWDSSTLATFHSVHFLMQMWASRWLKRLGLLRIVHHVHPPSGDVAFIFW